MHQIVLIIRTIYEMQNLYAPLILMKAEKQMQMQNANVRNVQQGNGTNTHTNTHMEPQAIDLRK